MAPPEVSDVEHSSASQSGGMHKGSPVQRDNLGEEIDPNAVGGTLSDLPKGYYLTPSFLGTFIATCMGISCFKLGYVLPVNTLGIINADIGKSPPSSPSAYIINNN